MAAVDAAVAALCTVRATLLAMVVRIETVIALLRAVDAKAEAIRHTLARGRSISRAVCPHCKWRL